jgi:uncharacterized integral membrane protein
MNVVKVLIAFLSVLVGVVFGALNTQRVPVDLWFTVLEARLGLSFLLVLLLGAVIGGLAVTVGVVWPLRRRLRRAGASTTNPYQQALPADSTNG